MRHEADPHLDIGMLSRLLEFIDRRGKIMLLFKRQSEPEVCRPVVRILRQYLAGLGDGLSVVPAHVRQACHLYLSTNIEWINFYLFSELGYGFLCTSHGNQEVGVAMPRINDVGTEFKRQPHLFLRSGKIPFMKKLHVALNKMSLVKERIDVQHLSCGRLCLRKCFLWWKHERVAEANVGMSDVRVCLSIVRLQADSFFEILESQQVPVGRDR